MPENNQETIRNEKGQYVKGCSGNPQGIGAGRHKGSFSFTTRVKQYLENNPQETVKIVNYFVKNKKMRELLWKMIDGMPKQPVDIEGQLEVKPILGGLSGVHRNHGDREDSQVNKED